MTIGLFAPLPLAMMIPFMAGQSLMMGEAFGKGFQYGKRKISSMSNDEFNALTPSDLGKSITTDYNAIIPHLGQAVQKSSEFQSLVIKEMIDVIKKLPGDIVSGFTQTSTSASLYGEGGTVTDVRQGGRTATFNEDAIQNTVQGIEDAARAYMEWSGLADFEQAKETIRNMIKAKKQDFTAGFQRTLGRPNISAVQRDRTTGLSRIQQVKAAAAANKIRLQDTVKQLAPLINNKRAELKLATARQAQINAVPIPRPGIKTNAARQRILSNRVKWRIAVQTLEAQLADLIKKLQNALTLLRNK